MKSVVKPTAREALKNAGFSRVSGSATKKPELRMERRLRSDRGAARRWASYGRGRELMAGNILPRRILDAIGQ